MTRGDYLNSMLELAMSEKPYPTSRRQIINRAVEYAGRAVPKVTYSELSKHLDKQIDMDSNITQGDIVDLQGEINQAKGEPLEAVYNTLNREPDSWLRSHNSVRGMIGYLRGYRK